MQNKSLKRLGEKDYESLLHGCYSIFVEEGFSGLYAGLSSGLAGTVFSNFTYFYWYSLFREIFERRLVGNSGEGKSTAFELGLGAAAGAVSQLFVLPISVITTRQQTAPDAERQNFMETAKGIVAQEGVLGLWSGFHPSMVLCSNPAITYGAFEKCKALWLKLKLSGKNPSVAKLHSFEIFLLGALSKTLATVVTYPYIMAKVRLQWKAPLEVQKKMSNVDKQSLNYKHSWDVLAKVYHQDGIRGWYKGMKAQIIKAVLCQAILFVTKAKFTYWTILLFRLVQTRRNIVPHTRQ